MDNNHTESDMTKTGLVTEFDDSIFSSPSEKAYTVKSLMMVELDIISSQDQVPSLVKEALSNLSIGENAQIVGSRVDIVPLELGEHVN